MTHFRPTLLVDIGGTLLTRDQLGPKAAVISWLSKNFDVPQALQLQIADAILTASDPRTAALSIRRYVQLADSEIQYLTDLVAAPTEEPVFCRGSLSLLRAAREFGWRVVFATNAVRWAPALPDSVLKPGDLYLSSADVGFSKRDPRYWAAVSSLAGVVPQMALSIGDSEVADVLPAEKAGIAAIKIVSNGDALESLTAAIRAAATPPSGAVALLAGRPESWAGKEVLRAPNLRGLVKRTTRAKISIVAGGRIIAAGMVVRRSGDKYPVVTCDRAFSPVTVAWVVAVPDRRLSSVMAEIEDVLLPAGLPSTLLTTAQRRQIASFIHEAETDEIRLTRINDILAMIESTRRAQ